MNDIATSDLLEVWSDDADVMAARATVDTDVTAVELAERISKLFYPSY